MTQDSDLGKEIIPRLLETGYVEMLCSIISRDYASAQAAITCLSCLLSYSDVQKQVSLQDGNSNFTFNLLSY